MPCYVFTLERYYPLKRMIGKHDEEGDVFILLYVDLTHSYMYGIMYAHTGILDLLIDHLDLT